MAVQLFKDLTFSWLEPPKTNFTIIKNLARVSIWGTLSSGAVALIFGRSLEGSLKEIAPYVFWASLISCITFANPVAHCHTSITQGNLAPNYDRDRLNKVSCYATNIAWSGLGGAVAVWKLELNPQLSSLKKGGSGAFLGSGIV